MGFDTGTPLTDPPPGLGPLLEAMDAVQDQYDHVVLAERTIRLEVPVKGDAGFAALRILGLAQGASPVGVAAHGPAMVAAAVWRAPDLYLARWTSNRWVAGYRLPRGARPADHIRSEGRIPSHLETGNWYASVPDEVRGAFAEVGLSLEAPPFPPPEPPPPPEPKTRARRSSPAPRADRPAAPPRTSAAAPKATKAAPKAAVKPPAPPTDQLCRGCNMRRARTQFTPGSDLCIDCR